MSEINIYLELIGFLLTEFSQLWINILHESITFMLCVLENKQTKKQEGLSYIVIWKVKKVINVG